MGACKAAQTQPLFLRLCHRSERALSSRQPNATKHVDVLHRSNYDHLQNKVVFLPSDFICFVYQQVDPKGFEEIPIKIPLRVSHSTIQLLFIFDFVGWVYFYIFVEILILNDRRASAYNL